MDNQLISILRTFTLHEITEFQKFCASPYHNKGRNLVPFLKIVCRFYPEFDSPKLTKEFLYRELFPGKKYSGNVINSAFSRLNKIAENYLIITGLNENMSNIKERLLINQLGIRGLKSRGENLIRRARENISHSKEEPFTFAVEKELEIEAATFYSVNNFRDKQIKSIARIRKLILYSFLSELFYFESGEMIGQHFMKDNSWEEHWNDLVRHIDLSGVLRQIESKEPESFDKLNLYYLFMKAVKESKNSENYFNLKKAVFENMDKMESSMKRFMLNLLGLISNHSMLNGKSEFRKESFEIKKKSVDENLFAFSASGYPKISEFRSTFIDAMNQKEYDWAEKFCEKFIGLIHPEDRENIRCYYESRLSYERGDTDSALALAMRVNINQITFKLDMKNLLAKIYFDTKSFQALLSLLDSYVKLTVNQGSKVSALQMRHRKFAAYMKRLVILEEKQKGAEHYRVLQDKVRSDTFTSKSWIEDRISKLMRSFIVTKN